MSIVKAYAAQSKSSPVTPFEISRREVGRSRHPHRYPVLRHLPLRHPPGTGRMGRHALPDGAGPRDRRQGGASWLRGQEVQGRRHRRRGLLRRLLPDLRRLQGASSSICEKGDGLHLQRHRDGPQDPDLRRLLDRDRGRRELRPQGPEDLNRPASRRSCAPASPRTRRCASWKVQEGRPRRRRRPRRPRPHGA